MFKIPDFRIGDSVWFLNGEDVLTYGVIDAINMAIKTDSAVIYYGIVDGDLVYTIREDDVIKYNMDVPKPKYQVGEEVTYRYLTKTGQGIANGVIEKIEMSFYQDGTYEICYFMDDDPDFWIIEDEVINIVNSIRTIKVEKEG